MHSKQHWISKPCALKYFLINSFFRLMAYFPKDFLVLRTMLCFYPLGTLSVEVGGRAQWFAKLLFHNDHSKRCSLMENVSLEEKWVNVMTTSELLVCMFSESIAMTCP